MLKKILASVAVGAILVSGGAYAAVAYASTPGGATPAATTSVGHTSRHAAHGWLKTHRKEIRKQGVAISAKTIGVTPKDLRVELRSGKSIAEVAGEHGVSAQSVVDALVSAADQKVNEAVSAKKLSSAHAAKIEARLPARITKAVDRIR